MKYPTHDTNWATSAKGNTWKRSKGILFAVGKRKDGTYWAMRDGKFRNGNFATKHSAMHAAEFGGEGNSQSINDDKQWG